MTTAQRLTEAELDASIRSTQEPQRTPEQVRSEWLEVLPEPEPVDTGIFFADPLADWACITAVVVAIAVLAVVVPGPM